MSGTTLTEKMKRFCREYVSNGGNGTQAYLAAYDSDSEISASVESSRLLTRDDIREYIDSLNRPMEDIAADELTEIKRIIWERIRACIESGDDAAIARYTDQLNRLGGRYANININKNDNTVNLGNIDLNALRTLSDLS